MGHNFTGHCPVCDKDVTFASSDDWSRDHLTCSNCRSIPRERAFSRVLDMHCADWRSKVIHESSPADRLVSNRLRDECANYIPTQFYPRVAAGTLCNGIRSKDFEAMSFEDNSIDIHCHLDVLDHVNHPDKCFADMKRTLKPGDTILFTTPIYENEVATVRRDYYDDKNQINFIGEPEYHGNPIDETGAPVTFHYGQDFSDMILLWTKNCGVQCVTLNDRHLGVIGKFREVFLVTKYS